MKCEKCGKEISGFIEGSPLCLNCYSNFLGDSRASAAAQGADEFEQSDILFGNAEEGY